MRVHPDTYLTRLTAFTTYDGKGMPQSHEWDDRTTPRTALPVRFVPYLGILTPQVRYR